MGMIGLKDLARLIDHTLLAPETSCLAVEQLCAEAVELGVGAVCVSPTMVSTAVGSLPEGFVVASVVGFPSGAHWAAVKAREAEQAYEDGAREIDMVINLAAVADGRWNEVSAEVAKLRDIVGGEVVLKVIIESALWDDTQIIESCKAAVAGGADFVKTSTGYHKAGGASIHAVRVMRDTVGSKVGVKASGGVRTFATAMEMITAGADRLGTSSARTILDGAAQTIANSDS